MRKASSNETAAVDQFKMFIDGEWVASRDGATIAIVDPATEATVALVAKGDSEDAEAAAQAARRAFDEGPWPRMAITERAAILRLAAAKVRERADALARLETLQMGKVLSESLIDMGATAYSLDCAANMAVAHLSDQPIVSAPPIFGSLMREPLGVVVAITPWNYPLKVASWKFAYALAAGNVVIVKPASVSPLTTLEMARIFQEVGLPDGAFQVLVGPGHTVGDYLCSSPLVDMVTFTGSFAVGVNIVRQAADTVKKVSLELGGKSPNIVFNDADFEAAIQGALLGAFRNVGQVCAAGSRLLVERGIYDRFVAEVVRRAKAIKVGPGLDAGSTMGPLAYRDRLDTVEEYVQSGQQEGAKLLCGGKRTDRAGFFYEPTIFGDVDNSMRIAQEEIFGPVLAVIPFDGEEEAIAIANDTIYGLGAGIWTRDLTRANRVAKAIRAGMVWVNTYNQSPGDTPWGGYKASGAGRERGEHGLYEFTELKSVVFDASGEPLGFYPAP